VLHSYFCYLQAVYPVTALWKELMQFLHSDLPLPMVKMFLSVFFMGEMKFSFSAE